MSVTAKKDSKIVDKVVKADASDNETDAKGLPDVGRVPLGYKFCLSVAGPTPRTIKACAYLPHISIEKLLTVIIMAAVIGILSRN